MIVQTHKESGVRRRCRARPGRVSTVPSAEAVSGFSIFIVEDDTPLRRSLELLAEGLGVRVRGFPSAEDFLKTDSDGQVGCLLTDVNLPGASGVAADRAPSPEAAPIVSIVLTGSEDSDLAFRAGRAGAIAFFRKPAAPDRLREPPTFPGTPAETSRIPCGGGTSRGAGGTPHDPRA